MFILGSLEENGIEECYYCTYNAMHMFVTYVIAFIVYLHIIYLTHWTYKMFNWIIFFFSFVWDTSGINNLKSRDYTKCLKISAAYIVQKQNPKIPQRYFKIIPAPNAFKIKLHSFPKFKSLIYLFLLFSGMYTRPF